ncbi:CDC33 Translation initiation factor 4E eIF-4E [Pyrenophora tritici-repentis]|uniref:CDC33, Translation initiation factor 4E (eIF-4E) n=1 Tax=Pyrenophora tritici-repentis TaxID=45151 RepID=A0A2W1IGR0_9PLEO|nr:CDC33, Translation initiation factor 4E (eIF-4E) [Pyrenophora tritici-repentis]KAG9384036.1 Eukaryotic translation initiation factor 4E type 3-A [Pyrenophora tritici-repentis]KAI0585136.1 Eukaryotic translation initiation factor 4E type 3-A [Pyrenophora tritici-repentis]KAI1514134.1 Eukaryotic initiation factor 4E [Pyrenophora tritici-repentis]KAI1533167.1 CDC33 Translation initiation factor 4E eIF-4E [Pyrenophora tritici-repentis]
MTMNETNRLIRMLRASVAQHADHSYSSDRQFHDSANDIRKNLRTSAAARKPLSVSLLEDLIYATKHGVPYPSEPLTYQSKVALEHILDTLNRTIPQEPAVSITFPTMAGRFPVLSTSNLPAASAEEQSATASPARGTAMLNNIFKSVRVPEFRFKWMFWAEKGQQAAPKDKSASSEEYLTRPKPLGEQIVSVKEFYQHFNNIPVENLKLRDSIHLFHLGVKPVWEDPRNMRGGAWYFKVSKDLASQFWHEMCLLAVGDILQGAVETKRASFNDDICGISYSVRWNAVQIAVWNRDADNEDGRTKLLAVILDKLSEELRPKKEDSYWYKAHKEHKGFIEQ